MELWDCHFMTCSPWLPRDIPWNSMELWSRQIKNHRLKWESIELGGRHFKWDKCSMEYSMEFHGALVPPNEIYDLAPWISKELWNCHFMACFSGFPRDIPWNSMELWSRQIKNHGSDISFGGTRVPWNSMEYSMEHLCHFKWRFPISLELS